MLVSTRVVVLVFVEEGGGEGLANSCNPQGGCCQATRTTLASFEEENEAHPPTVLIFSDIFKKNLWFLMYCLIGGWGLQNKIKNV